MSKRKCAACTYYINHRCTFNIHTALTSIQWIFLRKDLHVPPSPEKEYPKCPSGIDTFTQIYNTLTQERN